MSCQDHDPDTFADATGLFIDCVRCGQGVKFMNETQAQRDAFKLHGRVCGDCQEHVRREIIVRGWEKPKKQ